MKTMTSHFKTIHLTLDQIKIDLKEFINDEFKRIKAAKGDGFNPIIDKDHCGNWDMKNNKK